MTPLRTPEPTSTLHNTKTEDALHTTGFQAVADLGKWDTTDIAPSTRNSMSLAARYLGAKTLRPTCLLPSQQLDHPDHDTPRQARRHTGHSAHSREPTP